MQIGLGGLGPVLLEQRVIEQADQISRLFGDFHLTPDVFGSCINQEVQPVVFLFQVSQIYDMRIIIRGVHIVDVNLLEIGDNDPAGIHVMGQIARITPCLLKRSHQCAVRLFIALAQVNVLALLLNEYMGAVNVSVNKAGVSKLHGNFKTDKLLGLAHAENIAQKSKPERLGVLFFVAPACPVFYKLFCCLFLLM